MSMAKVRVFLKYFFYQIGFFFFFFSSILMINANKVAFLPQNSSLMFSNITHVSLYGFFFFFFFFFFFLEMDDI
jgi:hypothetical protein